MEPSKKNVVTTVVIIVLLAVAAYFGFKYYQLNQNPQQATQAEVNRLVTEIGRIIVLPEDETPTVATVSDPEALSEQAFFANAKEGDKVLIYTTARKAILYSPSMKKIIEVAPINIGNNQGAVTPSTTTTTTTTTDTDTEE